MKFPIRSRSRRFSNTPSIMTCISGMLTGASVSPAIVRQGLNHSRPAVSVPMRASVPSEITIRAL